MRLSPAGRKLSLTLHIGTSVGWLGAVAVSLALAISGLATSDPVVARSVFITLELVGWTALVPFSFGSLLTGLVQSLGTRWGLFRHYWVIVKLAINVIASAVLLLYMQTLEHFAGLARAAVDTGDLSALRNPSPVLHSSLALVLLLGAMVLSVYKPKGVTKYGRRRPSAETSPPQV